MIVSRTIHCVPVAVIKGIHTCCYQGAGSRTAPTDCEIARKCQLSPKLLERACGEWRAKGELAFRGIGRRGADSPTVAHARRIAELQRKIGQL